MEQPSLSKRALNLSSKNFLDPFLRRPKGDFRVEQSCLQIDGGYPVGYIRMSAIQTLKRIPLPVVFVDKPASRDTFATCRPD